MCANTVLSYNAEDWDGQMRWGASSSSEPAPPRDDGREPMFRAKEAMYAMDTSAHAYNAMVREVRRCAVAKGTDDDDTQEGQHE